MRSQTGKEKSDGKKMMGSSGFDLSTRRSGLCCRHWCDKVSAIRDKTKYFFDIFQAKLVILPCNDCRTCQRDGPVPWGLRTLAPRHGTCLAKSQCSWQKNLTRHSEAMVSPGLVWISHPNPFLQQKRKRKWKMLWQLNGGGYEPLGDDSL